MTRIRWALLGVALAATAATAQTTRISISTGGTGGGYYPLGGGMANILSKYVPELQATAEVTGGSVDNLKLIGGGKSKVGFTMADSGWDALQGVDKFKDGKVHARTLMVLYPNRLHVVTIEGASISKLSDLNGKRISTGSPGSGTEVMAFRLLDAVGIDKDRDIKKERLSIAESVNALKDRKIDAFDIAALAGGVQNWLFRRCTLIERILLIAASLLLVYPTPTADWIGLGCMAAVIASQKLSKSAAVAA